MGDQKKYNIHLKKKKSWVHVHPYSLLLIRSCILIWNSVSFHLKKRIEIRPVVTGKTKINKQKGKEEIRSISEFDMGTKAEHTCNVCGGNEHQLFCIYQK